MPIHGTTVLRYPDITPTVLDIRRRRRHIRSHLMKKLNQVLAIEKGVKTKAYARLSELHKTTQKNDLTDGFTKTYQPLREDGNKLPGESKKVQLDADAVFKEITTTFVELFNVTAQKDWANQHARADVVVDGKVLIKDAPPTYLLFLKKQLTDLETFVAKFVELKPDIDWTVDGATGLHKSLPVTTHRTEKVQEPIVKYAATPEHPAQTEMITRDVIVGHWTTTHFSGALSKTRKNQLSDRIQKMLKAVKEALEIANMSTAADSTVGNAFFDYLFA